MRYPIPARRHRVEETIQRSRFITTVAHAPSAADARAFIDQIKAEFPDATHNCWAFAAGPPADTAQVGMGDEGEPHGTAGRPMLNVLHHGGVGEIAAVVTRYYGGVKLGKGGLVRAYSSGVQHALEGLPTVEKVDRSPVEIVVEYGALEGLRRLLTELEAPIEGEVFGETVVLRVQVPQGNLGALEEGLADLTRGAGSITSMEGETE